MIHYFLTYAIFCYVINNKYSNYNMCSKYNPPRAKVQLSSQLDYCQIPFLRNINWYEFISCNLTEVLYEDV